MAKRRTQFRGPNRDKDDAPAVNMQLDSMEALQRRRRVIDRQLRIVTYGRKGMLCYPENRETKSALIRLQAKIDDEIAQHAILASGQL
jgi:hypothetical protein